MLLQDGVLRRGWGCTQGAVSRGLAELGVEFSEEAVEPVTGYRVDLLLHGGGDWATGRCAVEVGVNIIIGFVVAQPEFFVVVVIISISNMVASSL